MNENIKSQTVIKTFGFGDFRTSLSVHWLFFFFFFGILGERKPC